MTDDLPPPSARKFLDRALLARLYPFLRPHRGLLLAGIGILVLGFAADLLGPFLMRQTLDGPVRGILEASTVEADVESVEGSSRSEALRQVLFYTLGFLVVALAGAGLRYLQVTVLTLVGQRVTYDVRRTLFSHLLRLPQSFFDRRPTGELTTRITSDVENLSELFVSGVATVLFDLLRIVGVLVVLVWIHPGLALVILFGIPLYAFLSFRFRARARTAYRETRRTLAASNAFAQESLSGMSVIQLSVQESRMEERFEEKAEDLRQSWMLTVRQYAMFLPLVEFANQLVVATTFGFSAWMMLDGTITEGVFVQYWFYLRLIFDPIQEIADRYNVLQSALSSTERIAALLDETPEPSGDRVPEGKGALEFDRVSFSYSDGAQALHRVSFQIEPGETIAVVGSTGAGKTTLTQLLLSLYRAQAGAVKVNEVPVQDWRLEDLRRGIGVIPQDVFLFADTVLENIRLRDDSVSEDQVVEACKKVGAHEFLSRQPEGYHSRLGERGINLSSGQRQLLAFARILVHAPSILVLDEATSSVDSETEHLLQQAVEQIVRGRTCIVIAHRLSTIRLADRIFVMHHGELRETGTHRELLGKGGLYARLHELQFDSPA